jgi:hypothetical protein
MNAEIWSLTRATFTGAAILLREKAAYRNTSFQLTPKRQSANGIVARVLPVDGVGRKPICRSGWQMTAALVKAGSTKMQQTVKGREKRWN